MEPTFFSQNFTVETFYCSCGNPKCNISVYTYKSNCNDKIISMPVYCKTNCNLFTKNKYSLCEIFYYIEFNHMECVKNKKYPIRNKIYNILWNIDYYSFKVFKVLSFPFKVIYNFLYYISHDVKAFPIVNVEEYDQARVKEILPETEFSVNDMGDTGTFKNYYVIPKNTISFLHKIGIVLYGRMDLRLTIAQNLTDPNSYYIGC